MTPPLCDYCQQPAGSPTARHDPGNPASLLVGVTHDECFGRFLSEALAGPGGELAAGAQ